MRERWADGDLADPHALLQIDHRERSGSLIAHQAEAPAGQDRRSEGVAPAGQLYVAHPVRLFEVDDSGTVGEVQRHQQAASAGRDRELLWPGAGARGGRKGLHRSCVGHRGDGDGAQVARLPGGGVPAVDEDDVALDPRQTVLRRPPAGDRDAGDVRQAMRRVEGNAARGAGQGDDLDHAPASRVDDADVVGALAGRDRPQEAPVGRHGSAHGEVAERHLRPRRCELAAIQEKAGGRVGRVGRRERGAAGQPGQHGDHGEDGNAGESSDRHLVPPPFDRMSASCPCGATSLDRALVTPGPRPHRVRWKPTIASS